MKPTREQVQEEITKLKEMKPKVCHHTAFGDDNHAAIEVQIRVLEEGMDMGDVWERWDTDDHLCENGVFAAEWLECGGEPPSGPEGWGSLVRE